MDTLIINTDGGSRGNPGPSASAISVHRFDYCKGRYIGIATNNQAEYDGLLLALEETKRHDKKKLIVYSDSQLMVRQINGEYVVNSESIRPLYLKALGEIVDLELFEINYIPRALNKEADAEVNRVLDSETKKK